MRTTIGIRDIALKSLGQNKQRTVLTVLTAALSVALMLVVLTYFHSDEQRQKRAAINETGGYHVQYDNLTAPQLDRIRNSTSVKKLFAFQAPADVQIKQFLDLNMSMRVTSTEGINDGLIQLQQGRAPLSGNEIAMAGWVLEELGLKAEVGQEIKLDLQSSLNGSTSPHDSIQQTFTLVGIVDENAVHKITRTGSLFVSPDFIQQYSSDYQTGAYVLMKTDYQVSQLAAKLGKAAGLETDQIKLNGAYTKAYETSASTYLTAAVLILFIVFVAAIVVYNIFYIYISQKIRLFGVLKAIGATRQQIRRLIQFEGMLIALLGSLGGVLLGILLSLLAVPLLGGATNQGAAAMRIEFSPLIVSGSFILGIIMVMASIHAPARAAARMSEIDAIRFNPAKLGNGKRMRARPDAVPKARVSVASLIQANFWRHKKRVILTILSITMTGLVFLIASSLLNSMNIKNMTSMMIQGDYQLSGVNSMRTTGQSGEPSNPLSNELLGEIRNLDGVKELFTEKYAELIYNPEDAARHITFDPQEKRRNSFIGLNVYGYNDALIDVALGALQAGQVTRTEMMNNNYLIAINDAQRKYSPGDKIRVKTYDDRELEFTIAGVLPRYITFKGSDSDGGTFIAHEKLFARLSLDQRVQQLSVTVKKEKTEAVEQALRQIAGKDHKLAFASFKETYDEFDGMKRTIEMAAYTFIAVLLFISIFNLVNSILTSILSRNREISMIEAIGQTRGQLTLQLMVEGLLQVVISLIIVYAVGLPAGYIIVSNFQKEAMYASYQIPVLPMLVLAVSFMCASMIVTLAIQKRLHQKSLIERMRGME